MIQRNRKRTPRPVKELGQGRCTGFICEKELYSMRRKEGQGCTRIKPFGSRMKVLTKNELATDFGFAEVRRT